MRNVRRNDQDGTGRDGQHLVRDAAEQHRTHRAAATRPHDEEIGVLILDRAHQHFDRRSQLGALRDLLGAAGARQPPREAVLHPCRSWPARPIRTRRGGGFRLQLGVADRPISSATVRVRRDAVLHDRARTEDGAEGSFPIGRSRQSCGISCARTGRNADAPPFPKRSRSPMVGPRCGPMGYKLPGDGAGSGLPRDSAQHRRRFLG